MVFSVRVKVPIFKEDVPTVKPVEAPELYVPPFNITPPPVPAVAIAVVAPSVKVPALMVVEPVYELANE